MPKFKGVYRAGNGSWHFKVTLGSDPLTGKRIQLTKRGSPRPRTPPGPGGGGARGCRRGHDDFGWWLTHG